MGLYRRGKTWWLAFSRNGGMVYVSTKQKDRKLAERFAISYQAAVNEGRFSPEVVNASLSEILDRYLEVHLKPKNLKTYRDSRYSADRMLERLQDTPLSKLRSAIDIYKAWRRQSVSPSSVRRELGLLKAATKKALEWQMISTDPLAGYRLENVDDKRVRFIEDEEFQRLVNAAHPFLVPILLMARFTGMRQGEILKLTWEDVDLRRQWLLVRHAKNGESRYIPIPAALVQELAKTPVSQRTGLLFTRHGTGLVKDGFIRSQFRKAVRLAGLIDFRAHDLRHSFASHAAMRGMDIQTLAKILGHKDLRMTQRYSHMSNEYLKESIELAAPHMTPSNTTKTLQSATLASLEKHKNYPGMKKPPISGGLSIAYMVDPTGIEPATSSMPWRELKPQLISSNASNRRKTDDE